MKKTEYMRLGNQFQRYFGVNLNDYTEMVGGSVELDIFKFENYLIGHGYNDEKDGSMKDYITREFGKEQAEFIEDLLLN